MKKVDLRLDLVNNIGNIRGKESSKPTLLAGYKLIKTVLQIFTGVDQGLDLASRSSVSCVLRVISFLKDVH